MFLSACAGTSGITNIEGDKYVGIYSDRASGNSNVIVGDYKVVIKEQNGKLFGKDRRGNDELIQKTDTDFRLKSFDISGSFSEIENGKYQYLSIKEDGILVKRLTRLNIPQTRYEEAIYDSIDRLIKIDENKTQAECLADIKTGTVSEVSGDVKLTNELIEKFKRGSFGKQNSLLIMKDGRLVLEQYFRGWNPGRNSSDAVRQQKLYILAFRRLNR